MKYMVLLGDGMADFPLDELGGQTPLEAARTPAMDELVREGILGLFYPIPEGFPPGSDIGNLCVFGYNPATVFTGRAPLEASRQGITIGPDQVVFRCNLVTLRDGVMDSFTSGHISTEEARPIIESLNRDLSDLPVRFYAGVGYRHLCVVTTSPADVPALSAVPTEPPHNITDQTFESFIPQDAAAGIMREVMRRSRDTLAAHPVSQARTAAGKKAPTSVWLWGQGRAPAMPKYADLYGVSGAVVSAVDLVNGIGVCAGLRVLEVPGATGYLDTNYAGKVRAALDALNEVDFVYLHIEAPDETSHEGRLDLKLQAIEDFDANVVAPCLAYAKKRGDCRLLAAPDHVTALSTKTHAAGPVPFGLYGPGVEPSGARAYHERAAEESGILVAEGYRLTPTMLKAARISREILTRLAPAHA